MNIPPIIALLGAIAAEVTATNLLKASAGFTRIVPGILSVVAYGGVLYLLSAALSLFPLGPTYAIWSGVGIVASTLVGWLLWHENVNWIQVSGIGLILVGVVIVNLARTSPGNG
jgi:small multidrug resistance pump